MLTSRAWCLVVEDTRDRSVHLATETIREHREEALALFDCYRRTEKAFGRPYERCLGVVSVELRAEWPHAP
jgi:hypothetical protein